MIVTRGALRAIGAVFIGAVAVIWAIAWFAPGLGLEHDDGAYLIAARALALGQGYVTANLPAPVAQTKFPPLFPGVLALWSLVSLAPAWLKALSVVCSIVWLRLTWTLLRKMGAGSAGAALIIALTAAAPGVITFGANLFPDPLFAALLTACLILLLDGRPALSGVAAGLAALAKLAGIPLVAACMITLVARKRFRDAILFTAPAILLIAPWLGWALAHGAHDPGSGIDTWSASTILTALEPGDKLIVVLRNIEWLFASPFTALSGIMSPIASGIAALLLAVCLFRRRQLVPDLFVLLYALMLVCLISPPERFIAPVLPLVFWIIWRVAASTSRPEPVTALVVLILIVPVWQDFRRIPQTRGAGQFTFGTPPAERWTDLRQFFATIRRNTENDATLAANLDTLFYFETGRKSVRGFEPSGFDLFYSPRPFVLPPDQLYLALLRNRVSYFALTPGDITESGSPLHTAVEALERGGILTYVPIEGLPDGYALLRVFSLRQR